ncbi:competence type IV pilus major pilin ComGC [Armatimonas rosea]|uniref:Prepilin-type N-terminal cleavage/methylation domain-containing protein n=1 Tax=Armatimonas rosea TaxID=685828 RepID=A0A7W9SMA5_ARMRO|nr:prepilin-type N-terminal cleavage/methylation domain-containing protein [Armatimonas rosea]MBB6048448.1 prepilin-type N-terminal cleavage/methylation domain-containing protein [Armatimonas rosea]
MRSLRRAFTLVEIMIVVLIIGILVSIAVPNFVRARESARARACVGNLRQIDSAKEQYAMDFRLAQGATLPALSVLCGTGTGTYIKGNAPVCPSNGTYTVNVLGTDPTCSVGTGAAVAHVLP